MEKDLENNKQNNDLLEEKMRIGLRGKTMIALGSIIFITFSLASYFIDASWSKAADEAILKVFRQKVSKDANSVKYLIETAMDEVHHHAESEIVKDIFIGSVSNEEKETKEKDIRDLASDSIEDHRQFYSIGFYDLKGNPLLVYEPNHVSSDEKKENPYENIKDEDYFTGALEAGYDNVYISSLHGHLDVINNVEIEKQIFSISAPVYKGSKPIGVVVIDVLIEEIFNNMMENGKDGLAYIVDKNGEIYLGETGTEEKILKAKEHYDLHKNDIQSNLLGAVKSEDGYVISFNRVFYDRMNSQKYWTIVYESSEKLFTSNVRTTVLFLAFLFSILAIVPSALYISRKVINPIETLASATRRMEEGDDSVQLLEKDVEDEFRELYQAVNSFAESRKNSIEKFEKDLDDRTKELSQTYERLRSFFDGARDGIITVDAETGEMIFFSTGAEKMFGYKREEVLGKGPEILMPEDIAMGHNEKIRDYGKKTDNNSPSNIVVSRARNKDGREFDVEISTSKSEGPQGVFLNAVIRDISYRISYEKEMKKLSNAIEAAGEAVVVTNTKGIIEYVNPAFETITGYTKDESIGSNLRILQSGKHSKSFYENYWKRITGGKVWKGEFINKRKNGEIYYDESTVTPILDADGKIINYVAIKNDVSKARMAEKALAEKNIEIHKRAEYERIYANILALFGSSHDKEHIVKEMLNTLAHDMNFRCSAYYDLDDWEGRLVSIASYGFPGDVKNNYAFGEGLVGQVALNKEAVTLTDTKDFPITIDTGIAKIKPTVVILQPVLYRNEVMGVLVMASVSDFLETEKNFIERLSIQLGVSLKNIRQYVDLQELSDQLRQRGEEIIQKNVELESASRLKTDFLANMSHELRTPLNAIVGFSEILKDGMIGKMSEEQTEYVTDIFTSGRHLLSLINDILDLSKIEAGKMDVSFDIVDIETVLKESGSLMKENAQREEITLSYDFKIERRTCYMDEIKLKQILLNLLSNAIKFTHKGGKVTLGLNYLKEEDLRNKNYFNDISLSISSKKENDGYFEIYVEDTGIGIKDKDKVRLFRAFEQLDSSMSKQYKGTGLGLALVKRLCQLQGGDVTLESVVNKGTRFTVILPCLVSVEIDSNFKSAMTSNSNDLKSSDDTVVKPIEKKEVVKEEVEEAGEDVRKDCKNILVATIDEKEKSLIHSVFEGENYELSNVNSSEEAIFLLKNSAHHGLIVDIELQKRDNWKILGMLEDKVKFNKVPIIFSHASQDDNNVYSMGFSSIVKKPFADEDINKVIETISKGKDKVTVLVVDDNPQSVERISRPIENIGCNVVRAYGGNEGKTMALMRMPDIVVINLELENFSGFSVCASMMLNGECDKTSFVGIVSNAFLEKESDDIYDIVNEALLKGKDKDTDPLHEVRRALYEFSEKV